ncbi:EamA family transporter [Aquicoccus sp. SCR17]|nr:EamA family transporter [Carideicomes alvinocaridis]
MTSLIGELFATFAAFCYALGSVATTKNARTEGGGGSAVLLSVVLTALLSAGLWVFAGPTLAVTNREILIGIGCFVVAGVLGTILGRVLFFRSIELAGAIETGLMRRLIPVFAALLAILVLGEAITLALGLAFLLVFSGVGIVILAAPRRLDPSSQHGAYSTRDRNAGRVLALVSAGSYGGSYTMRKFSMNWLPDPLAGAFIGAVTAMAWYAFAALFNAGYRRQVRELFRRPAFWQAMAAISISVGQTAQFVALKFTSVTAVAIIGTVEMFISAWLAAFVFKTEARPGAGFVVASLLALAGVTILALSRA